MSISKVLKNIVWDKFIGVQCGFAACYLQCGNNIRQSHFECGHVISRNHNGPNICDNLRPICSNCNKSMGSKNMIMFVNMNGLVNCPMYYKDFDENKIMEYIKDHVYPTLDMDEFETVKNNIFSYKSESIECMTDTDESSELSTDDLSDISDFDELCESNENIVFNFKNKITVNFLNNIKNIVAIKRNIKTNNQQYNQKNPFKMGVTSNSSIFNNETDFDITFAKKMLDIPDPLFKIPENLSIDHIDKNMTFKYIRSFDAKFIPNMTRSQYKDMQTYLSIINYDKSDNNILFRMHIGYAIYNICIENNMRNKSYSIYKGFLKPYVEKKIIKHLWKTIINDKIENDKKTFNIDLLKSCALRDNPILYEYFQLFHMSLCIDCSESIMSKYIRDMYYESLVCTYIYPNSSWYVYNIDNNGLRKMINEHSGIIYINKYIDELKSDFSRIYSALYYISTCNEFIVYRDQILERLTMLRRCYLELGKFKFRRSIYKCCTELFFDADFTKKLDNTNNIMCFDGGVYDTDSKSWRKIKATDYVTKKSYLTMEEVIHSNTIDSYNILKSIFPDDNLCEHVLLTLSQSITGNKNKIVSVWSNFPENIKSFICDILEMMFGTYCEIMPLDILLDNKHKSGEMNLCDTKIIIFTNVKETPKIHSKIECCDILSKKNILPILFCDTKTISNDYKNSINNNFIFYNYDQVEKKLDYTFTEEEIINLASGFAKMLLDRCHIATYTNNKKLTQILSSNKEQYMNKNNTIQNFIKNKIKYTTDEYDYIKLMAMHKKYLDYTNKNGFSAESKYLFNDYVLKNIPNFRKRFQPTINGKPQDLTNVFTFCKFIDDDANQAKLVNHL